MNNKPVAWLIQTKTAHQFTFKEPTSIPIDAVVEPLYTHPAELTDEEIYRLLADSIWAVGLNTDCLDEQNWADGITVAKAILIKAQEKYV